MKHVARMKMCAKWLVNGDQDANKVSTLWTHLLDFRQAFEHVAVAVAGQYTWWIAAPTASHVHASNMQRVRNHNMGVVFERTLLLWLQAANRKEYHHLGWR